MYKKTEQDPFLEEKEEKKSVMWPITKNPGN